MKRSFQEYLEERVFINRKLALVWLNESNLTFDQFIHLIESNNLLSEVEFTYFRNKVSKHKKRFETAIIREARSCYFLSENFLKRLENDY